MSQASSSNNNQYDIISAIAGGTCGDVMKGRNIQTGKIVAMKKIKQLHENEGMPKSALFEIHFLRKLAESDTNSNIIRMDDVYIDSNSNVYLVLEYCDYDLQGLLSHRESLTLIQVKCYFRQLLQALKICHDNKLIHRDLKPANILLTQDNVVKLCDFGLARKLPDIHKRPQTTKVITIWYRPPELLLGTDHYGTEIDVWSAGCILYEMITKNVLFQSTYDNEVDEITTILRVHGIPTDKEWTTWKSLPQASLIANFQSMQNQIAFEDYLKRQIRPEFAESIGLILSMLQYDPQKRISVGQALEHPFVSTNFEQFLPSKLPQITLPSCHQSKYAQSQTNTKQKNTGKIKPPRTLPKR